MPKDALFGTFSGLAWLEANPLADPKYEHSEAVFGVISTNNADAAALDAAITEPVPDCSGGMHHVVANHCLFIKANGWEAYVTKMKGDAS